MKREVIVSSPRAAWSVLGVGLILYFFACAPLYTAEFHGPVHPVGSAMAWLWVPVVSISAVFAGWSMARAALSAGFAVIASLLPVSTDFTAVAILAGVPVVELTSRAILSRLREFSTYPHCSRCGYLLHGLRDLRCPECGTAFSVPQADSAGGVRSWLRTHKTTSAYVVFFFVAMPVFVTLYWAQSVDSVRASAKRRAELDWAGGKATWYVTHEELAALTTDQLAWFNEMWHEQDPATGLIIKTMPGGQRPNWWYRAWLPEYRATIRAKLLDSGRPLPFGAR